MLFTKVCTKRDAFACQLQNKPLKARIHDCRPGGAAGGCSFVSNSRCHSVHDIAENEKEPDLLCETKRGEVKQTELIEIMETLQSKNKTENTALEEEIMTLH